MRERGSDRSEGWPENKKACKATAIKSTYGDCSTGWGMVIPKTGIYTVTLNVMWQANNTGARGIGIRRVGENTTGYLGESRIAAAQNTVTAQSVTATDAFNAGDTIQFYGYQTSGGNVGIVNDGRTSVEAHFVGSDGLSCNPSRPSSAPPCRRR